MDGLADKCADFHDVCKVAFYDAGDAATHELPVLQKRLGERHAVILSGANWVDVMKPGVNKGRAMQMLQTLKGLSPDACMAFGDYLNDLELLQSVTESYAMENALDDLKRIAKHIAPPNDEDGVMRVVKERFGVCGRGTFGDAVPKPLQGISSLDPSSLRGCLKRLCRGGYDPPVENIGNWKKYLAALRPKVSKGRPESPLAGFGAGPHFF